MTDHAFILRTFELARRGLGSTWPNPLVGAVIVKEGRVIGEGYHHRAGLDHAEVDAIKNATESVADSTLYVNLEPCCHTQKQTPPCAQRLIQEKIKKIVIRNIDPNPKVSGKGIELLRKSGIEVVSGILSEEGERLNEVFFHAQRKQRPFIHLKLASTLDGKIAMNNGDSKWITGVLARNEVQILRSQHQAILVGAETLRKDNPKPNVRLPDFVGEQPYRVVLTRSGQIPSERNLFTDENRHRTLVYTMKKTSIDLPNSQVMIVSSLSEAMEDLMQKKIMNCFLEGGAHLAGSFLREKFIQRVSLFLNPSFLGEGLPSLGEFGLNDLIHRPQLKKPEIQKIGEDFLITGRID